MCFYCIINSNNGIYFFSCSSDLSSVWMLWTEFQHFLNFNLLLWLGLTTKQKCVSLFYSSDQMKRGSEFYCWKHCEKWSSRYQGAGCTSRNQTPGHFFSRFVMTCWEETLLLGYGASLRWARGRRPQMVLEELEGAGLTVCWAKRLTLLMSQSYFAELQNTDIHSLCRSIRQWPLSKDNWHTV